MLIILLCVFLPGQAAEEHSLEPSLASKRKKKRRAPAPPNPFTGQVETNGDLDHSEDEEETVDHLELEEVG